MPLDEPETVMRHALYGVCTDFISKLQEGCPEVTEIVTKESFICSVYYSLYIVCTIVDSYGP